ncbi:MAG: hypothetical protein ACR2MO_08665 [Acidimicrobiales bacterium]
MSGSEPERDANPDADAAGSRVRAHLAHLVSLDFLVPALLGVLSLAVVFLASQSLAKGGDAASADRQYGLGREQQEIEWARAEGDVQAAAVDFASLTEELDLAARLERTVAALPPGDPRADHLRAERAELRQVAGIRLLRSRAADYVTFDAIGRPALDEKALRKGLRAHYEGFFAPRPELSVQAAGDARDRTERLAILTLALAAAGLVTTVAHVSRVRRRKAVLAGIGLVAGFFVLSAYALWAS